MTINDRIESLTKVEKALKELFANYEPKGAITFYIWGSLTREDYDPAISDVDLIFILSDFASPGLQNEIKKDITDLLPGFHEIGGQGLYLSELNGGPTRSFFAGLHPFKLRQVLTNFEDWHYVCGRKFVRQDFQLTDLSLEAQIQMTKDQIIDIIKNINDPQRNWRKDMVKFGLKLAYLKATKNNNHFVLNYNTLVNQVSAEDKDMVGLFTKLRKQADYRKEIFDQNLPIIQQWLNQD